jgi:outer membrane protein assembly factor BamB
MSCFPSADLVVVAAARLSSAVRAIDWTRGISATVDGVVASCMASVSLHALPADDSDESALLQAAALWELSAEVAVPSPKGCLADAGTATSDPTGWLPALLVLPSPLVGAAAVALVAGTDRSIAWATEPLVNSSSEGGRAACLGPPALGLASAPAARRVYLHSDNGTVVALGLRDGRALWAWPPAEARARAQAEAAGSRLLLLDANASIDQLVTSLVRTSWVRNGTACGATRVVRALAAAADGAATTWEHELEDEEAGAAREGRAPLCACAPGLRPPRLSLGAPVDPSSGAGARLLVATLDPCALALPPPRRGGGTGELALGEWARGMSNGSFVALDAQTGALRWAYALPADARCSSAALDFDSRRLFAVCSTTSDTARPRQPPVLLALDAEDGALLWSLPLAAPAHTAECGTGAGCAFAAPAARPAVSADGVVSVLGAALPAGKGAAAVCVLLRVATRAALGAAPTTLPRLLRAVRLDGAACEPSWFEQHARDGGPLVLLGRGAHEATVAVAAGQSLWLLRPAGACSGVACHHGVCRGGRCYCEADFLGPDCSQRYSPTRAAWPLWIGLGALLSLLALFAVCLLAVYRSFLWVKFRLQMMQVQHTLEARGYSLSRDDSAVSATPAASVAAAEAPAACVAAAGRGVALATPFLPEWAPAAGGAAAQRPDDS